MLTRLTTTEAQLFMRRYGVVLLSVAITALLTLPLSRLHYPNIFPLFLVAVIVSTWYGGLGPGLLATGLAAVVSSLFYTDILLSTGTYSIEWLVLFVLVSCLISWLNAARQRTETALRASERHYRLLFEHNLAGVYLSTLDGRILDCNESFAKMLGFNSREDVLSRPAADFYFDIAHRKSFIERLQQEKLITASEVCIRGKDDRPVWMIENVNLLEGEDGARTLIQGTAIDITGRKRAEEAINFQAHVLNVIEQSVIAVDIEGIVTYWNRFAEKLYGWSSAEAVGQSISKLVPAGATAEQASEIMARLRQGQSWAGEFSVQRRDGTIFPVMATDSPIYDERGRLVGIVGVSIDVTERRRAEDALREQKEILQKIFDHIPVTVVFFGEGGHLKLVNREWLRTIGWSLAEIKEQNLDIFAACFADPQEHQAALDSIAAANGEWADFKIRTKDGRVIDMSCAVVLLSDGTNIGIGQDITERKRVEQKLDERLRFETLLTELSAAFANLPSSQVEPEIDRWLQRLVEFLQVDRATFFHFGEDGMTLHRSHSYTVPGVEPLARVPINGQFPWIAEQIRQGQTVNWTRVPEDIPVEAVTEREYVAKVGVKSGLNIPVLVGGSVLCAISFTSIFAYREWPNELVSRLRLVGEIFANAFARQSAERAVRESEARFRAIFEEADIGIMLRDMQGYCLESNPALCDMLGYSSEELRGMQFTIFSHPDSVERDWKLFQELVAGKRDSYKIEKRYLRKYGEVIWVRLIVSLIHTAEGNPLYTIGMVENITERKRAEEERERLLIREQEARLRAEVMRDANLALTQDLSLERVLETLLHYLHKLVPFDSANVMLAEGNLQFAVSAIKGYEKFLPDVRVAKASNFDANGNALLGRISTTRHSVLVADTAVEPAWQRVPGSEHVRNWMGVPLVANGQVIGLYSLDKAEPGYFTAEHVREAEALAAQAASAIQNARLFEQVERYAAELEQRIVERKQAEESLTLFRNLIDRSSDAIEVIDPDTLRFLDCNESAHQTLGYSREEFLSLSVFDIDPIVDSSRLALFEEEIEKSGFLIFESFHRRKDGTTFPVEVNVKVVRLERDYRLSVVRDITERKRAEAALRQAEEKYHSIFENAVEGIFQSTPDGRFITANPAYARMLGYDSPEELLSSRTDIERQHYVEPERRLEFKRQLEEQGVVQEFEHQAYHKNGHKIWLSENVRAARDDSGAVLYYEGFTEDVTERKRVEQALKESEREYRGLFESAHDAIIIFLPEEEIVLEVNQRACEIYGFSRAEFIGMSLKAISQDVERGNLRVVETIERGTFYNFETIQYRRDGTEMFLDINASVVEYKGQRAIQSINRDITKRKRAEEILQTFPRRLIETQEAERRRVARELHDEIGQALTAIKLNLQNARFADDVTPHLDESSATIDQALQQVRDLSFDLRPSLLDDLGLIAALRWHLDREAQRAGLISEFAVGLLATRLPAELETACFRIAQEALTNVVRHAQAKRVTIQLRQHEAELHLVIQDDGIGFNARALGNGRASEKNLGVQGMQERALILGGNLIINSAPAGGTEIHAWFPLSLFTYEEAQSNL